MSQLFNDIWMKKYQSIWNKDPELSKALEKISFDSTIGYGFPDETMPRGFIIIQNGHVVDAGRYEGQPLNWDLRAKEDHWKEWLNREVGVTSVGLAYSTGKLKFIAGDYKNMIKSPSMSRPFVKSFSAMGRV